MSGKFNTGQVEELGMLKKFDLYAYKDAVGCCGDV